MADTREIIITVRNGSQVKGGKTILDENKEQRERLREIQEAINSPASSAISSAFNTKTVSGFVGAQLANMTMNTINQAVDFSVSHAGQFTGDIGVVHTIQKIQAATRLAKTGTSLASAALSGAIAGSFLPVPGGQVIGAAIMVGMRAVSEALSYGRQAFEYSTGTASDSRSVMFIKQRAGQEKTNWSR